MSDLLKDTIFALATPRGFGGVAVIRVSGPHALDGLYALSDIQAEQNRFRYAQLCILKRLVSRETLDHALVLTFKAPHSYTGEDVVEYHVHGGIAVVDGALAELALLPGHRMAEPGEFTRRAFENGKMDLTEAEAVADLIHAETTLQKQQALLQMEGALGRVVGGWREALTRIVAYVEAEMEFPDEDLFIDVQDEIRPQILDLSAQMDSYLNDNRRGERLRNGIHIAVIGAPNAGKSSLVNALAQRNVAIVSDLAGTTRDVVDVHLDIGGYPVILSDTAGLRPDQIGDDAHSQIESEGIRRALDIAERADIRIVLYDATTGAPDVHSYAIEKKYKHTLAVVNKIDTAVCFDHPTEVLSLSVHNNTGFDHFLEALVSVIEAFMSNNDGKHESPIITRQRHRDALVDCRHSLERSLSAAMPELIAEDLRLALRHLGRITGRVDVENLLDVVFRDFCIGK
ncbi:MAG: tRNA uridine-5-carboxymethylaminomethyl(34) synthesis GTPase MnmE [Alphaproteobacteria bacterium]